MKLWLLLLLFPLTLYAAPKKDPTDLLQGYRPDPQKVIKRLQKRQEDMIRLSNEDIDKPLADGPGLTPACKLLFKNPTMVDLSTCIKDSMNELNLFMKEIGNGL